MLKVLVILAVGFAIAVIPVMFAARLVGAGKHGFGSALLAVIFQAVLTIILRSASPSPLVIIIIAVLGGSAIYAYVLDTTFVRGFLLSIVATVISTLIVIGLASLLALGGGVA